MRHLGKFITILALFSMPLVWPDQKVGAAILLISAFLISLQSQRREGIDRNKWLMALMVYLPISVVCAPKIRLAFGSVNLGGMWMWSALAWCIGYYVVYSVVSRICIFREKDRERIAWAVAIPAIISAGYVCLQFFNLDQWQYTRPYSEIGLPQMAHLTALIGNPTYLAVYLAACLPFVFAYFGIVWGSFCLLAMLLCQSDTALYGGVVALSLILALRLPRSNKVVILPLIALCVILAAIVCKDKFSVSYNGRLDVWHNTVEDWKAPPIIVKDAPAQRTYALTGRGLGSFAVMFPVKHPPLKGFPIWDTAHNEYLEALYSIGLIGFCLMSGALIWLFYTTRKAVFDKFYGCVYLSAVFLAISAGTLPVWHQEPMRMMFVIFAGLLINNALGKGPATLKP